jgi:hypothetical protein
MSPEPPEGPPPGPQETLAKVIRHQAMLREIEAELNPGDGDVSRVADGLRDFALWIEQQGSTDDRFDIFVLLGEVVEDYPLDEALSRYDFANPESESTYDDIFDLFIDDLLLEASGRLTYRGDFEGALEAVQEANPIHSMGACVYLRDRLESCEAEVVLNARMAGLSWGQIGRGLGIPWQLVQANYARYED